MGGLEPTFNCCCQRRQFKIRKKKGFCRFLFRNGRVGTNFELLLPAAAIQNLKKEAFLKITLLKNSKKEWCTDCIIVSVSTMTLNCKIFVIERTSNIMHPIYVKKSLLITWNKSHRSLKSITWRRKAKRIGNRSFVTTFSAAFVSKNEQRSIYAKCASFRCVPIVWNSCEHLTVCIAGLKTYSKM